MQNSSDIQKVYFSIVIPTYNRAHLLKTTLIQILRQQFSDFEIIIVDDGSTDATGQAIEDLLKSDSRLKYYYKENEERAVARNFGFKHSSGKYVVFFDSDDIMLEDHLSVLYKATNDFPQSNFFATKFSIKRGDNIVKTNISFMEQGNYDYQSFLHGNYLACNICVKKDNEHLQLFEENRRYAIMEDWMFMLSNLKNDSLYLIDKSTIIMVDHDNRSMANNKLVIARRALATEWVEQNVLLSDEEVRELKGYSSFFSAIHYYLEYERCKALQCNLSAMMQLGFKRKILLSFIKFIIGKKTIERFKNVL